MVEFFKEPIRYLKRSYEKESQFEKPYLDGEYRKMHLKLPELRWPNLQTNPMKVGKGSPWEPSGEAYVRHLDAECWVDAHEVNCEDGTLEAEIHLENVPPHTASSTWEPKLLPEGPAEASDPSDYFPEHLAGTADFTVQVTDLGISNLVVGGVVILRGSFTLVHRVIGVWDPAQRKYVAPPARFSYSYGGLQGLPYGPWSTLKMERIEAYTVKRVECEGAEVEVDCCNVNSLSWDSETSASEIDPDSSVLVAVIVDLALEGGSYKLSWSVSGNDYWLEYSTTTGSTNTLYAGPDACNRATITVKACSGALEKTTSGVVKCTEGEWSSPSSVVTPCSSYISTYHCPYPYYASDCFVESADGLERWEIWMTYDGSNELDCDELGIPNCTCQGLFGDCEDIEPRCPGSTGFNCTDYDYSYGHVVYFTGQVVCAYRTQTWGC